MIQIIWLPKKLPVNKYNNNCFVDLLPGKAPSQARSKFPGKDQQNSYDCISKSAIREGSTKRDVRAEVAPVWLLPKTLAVK